jgi:subtilisin family serine protease
VQARLQLFESSERRSSLSAIPFCLRPRFPKLGAVYPTIKTKHTMPTSIRLWFFSAALVLASAPLCAATPKDDLLAAAKAGDVRKVAEALAAGADVNSKDAQGQTALMLAAGADGFAPCRELLWAGADANLKDKAGHTAAEHIDAETDENLPLRLLVRAYAYLQRSAQRATEKPTRPSLVMIMEDTVNYLHPKIKAAYQLNQLEVLGTAGVDDNKDGFVDDAYGWIPVLNKPYVIREAQLNAYLKNREAIARIIKIDNDHVDGKLTDLEAETKLAEYTNPLSDIMGPLDGLSDADFLNMIKNAGHGSHVAGIVLDASEGTARLHTLAHDFAEESRRLLGPDSDQIIEKIHHDSFEPEVVMRELRTRLLAHNTEIGRISSRYIRAMGAGVANLSFGGGLGWWRGVAAQHIRRCLEDHNRMDPTATLDEDIDVMSARMGLELYSASAAEMAVVFYENPDVLFVVSAGNDSADNDASLPSPAYFSRLFPNVITVASTDANGEISSFSNYGVNSVNIGAPGEHILSTVIPEASIYMNGTSMAAPYVAGVAALVRSLAPTLTATELRRLIDYTAKDVEQLHRYISSGGLIDKEMLRAVFAGNARAKSNAQARIAQNAALLPDALYPRHGLDAERAALKSIELDKTNPEAWRARAITFLVADDAKKALEHIDQALKLDPRSEPAWMERAAIESKLGNNAGVFESIGKAIDVLAASVEPSADFLRARRLVLRASLHLQLDEKDEARADVTKARELNPGVEMSDELEALL